MSNIRACTRVDTTGRSSRLSCTAAKLVSPPSIADTMAFGRLGPRLSIGCPRAGTYLRKYVKEAQDKQRYRERFYLQHYILILANSGIRIGEARHLRWRDIQHQNTERSEATDLYSSRQDRGAGGCL